MTGAGDVVEVETLVADADMGFVMRLPNKLEAGGAAGGPAEEEPISTSSSHGFVNLVGNWVVLEPLCVCRSKVGKLLAIQLMFHGRVV